MRHSLIRAGFTAAGGLGALLGPLATGTDAGGPAILHNWINSAGGSFHAATNWSPLGEPGPVDTAVFDVGTLYTVTFSQSATNTLLIIDDVDVTFDLPPFAIYALNGVVIGDNDTLTPGRLRLINGIVSVQPLPPPPPPNPPPPCGGMMEITAEQASILADEGLEQMLAAVFGMTIENAERWHQWVKDWCPCWVTTREGRTCRNGAHWSIETWPSAEWREHLHARCRTHWPAEQEARFQAQQAERRVPA